MQVRAGYKQTEVGVIPENWEQVRLGELFVFKNGLNKEKGFFGYGTPIVNYMDVFSRPAIRSSSLEGRVFLSKHEIKNFDVRKGDVFFTRTSETTDEIGMASVMLDAPTDTVFSGFVLRARPLNQRLDDEFKACCFSSSLVRKQIISKASYTTRALTNGGILSQVLLPTPPLAEQRDIATALSDVDALLAAQDKLIAKKRDIKQAAMQRLLTGKQRLPGFSGDWEVRGVGDVAELKNGFAFKSNTYTELGQFKVVTIANVQDGYMTVEECNKVADIPADLQRHQKLMRRNILISMTGNVGRVCRVAEDDCLLNQRVGKLVPFAIDDDFFFSQLCRPTFATEMALRATGGAQGNLSKSDIVDYELAVPVSLEEQTAIAAVLSDMDADLAALEQQLDKTRALKQGMMQELLTGRIRLV